MKPRPWTPPAVNLRIKIQAHTLSNQAKNPLSKHGTDVVTRARNRLTSTLLVMDTPREGDVRDMENPVPSRWHAQLELWFHYSTQYG